MCTADAYRAVIVLSQSLRVVRTVSLLSSANTIRGLNIPPTVPVIHCTQRIKYFLPKSPVGLLWLATDATAWPAVLIDYLAQKLLAFAPASSGYAHPAGSACRWILHRADEFAPICDPSVADLQPQHRRKPARSCLTAKPLEIHILPKFLVLVLPTSLLGGVGIPPKPPCGVGVWVSGSVYTLFRHAVVRRHTHLRFILYLFIYFSSCTLWDNRLDGGTCCTWKCHRAAEPIVRPPRFSVPWG